MRLQEIMQQILAGALDGSHIEPSPYDYWLQGRLLDGSDSSWLAGQNLHAATTFCRLLGAELLRLDREIAEDPAYTRHAELAAGFAVAHHGEEAICAALAKLAADADGPFDAPAKAFGKLFRDMRELHQDEETFGVAPHSMQRITRRCFSRFLCWFKDSVMRASLGATGAELLALEQDRILAPRRRLPGIRLRWLVADGRALIDELSRVAGDFAADHRKWETIQLAKTRSGVSVGRIIAAIRKGEIRLRMSPGNRTITDSRSAAPISGGYRDALNVFPWATASISRQPRNSWQGGEVLPRKWPPVSEKDLRRLVAGLNT